MVTVVEIDVVAVLLTDDVAVLVAVVVAVEETVVDCELDAVDVAVDVSVVVGDVRSQSSKAPRS